MFSHLAQSNDSGSSKNRAKIRAAAVLAGRKNISPDDKKKQILARVENNVTRTQISPGSKKSPKIAEKKEFMGKSLGKIDIKGLPPFFVWQNI